jgi:hypothetical protein
VAFRVEKSVNDSTLRTLASLPASARRKKSLGLRVLGLHRLITLRLFAFFPRKKGACALSFQDRFIDLLISKISLLLWIQNSYPSLKLRTLALLNKHLFMGADLYLSLKLRPVALKRSSGVVKLPFSGLSLLFRLAKCLVKVLLSLPPAVHLI